MRGIISYGAYLPHRRLDRSTIAAVAGTPLHHHALRHPELAQALTAW